MRDGAWRAFRPFKPVGSPGTDCRDGRSVATATKFWPERTSGRTAAEIADELGIDRLHELEATIAVEALDGADAAVIGPASSVCESSAARDAMAAHTVVWLAASPELLAAKAVRTHHRPLPSDTDLVTYFRNQLAVREPLIAALDPLVVDVEAQDDQAAATVILGAVSRAGT